VLGSQPSFRKLNKKNDNNIIIRQQGIINLSNCLNNNKIMKNLIKEKLTSDEYKKIKPIP